MLPTLEWATESILKLSDFGKSSLNFSEGMVRNETEKGITGYGCVFRACETAHYRVLQGFVTLG